MRDPDRIGEMLCDLGALWERDPDLRLHQLLSNLMRAELPDVDLHSVEDRWLHRRIRRAQTS